MLTPPLFKFYLSHEMTLKMHYAIHIDFRALITASNITICPTLNVYCSLALAHQTAYFRAF